jgi:hypothetical protein
MSPHRKLSRYELENRILIAIVLGCLVGLGLCWWLG